MKKPKENPVNPYHIHYDNYLDTNASTECTGLLYRPAQNGEEWENSHDIFNFRPGHKDSFLPQSASKSEEE